MTGPTLPISEELHQEKYRSPGESFREAMNRIANALSDNTEHFHESRDVLLDQRFLMAGRIQSAMGAPKQVTALNCFVSGTIEDNLTHDHGIMQRASEAATTMRMGGGIGYDFSKLRPRGTLISSLLSRSSGPVSFMGIYDAICHTIASSGHRRGAQMSVLRVDHPDIEEFIHAKQNDSRLTGFNISIGVTDEFMRAVVCNGDFALRFEGRTYKTVDARALWEQIMRSTWDWAEPGVLFLDTINKMNNLYYCEDIAATNPCGEQPLPPHGACLLGSVNLVKYIRPDRTFNWDQLHANLQPIVRSMDNVIDRTIYPLAEQAEEQRLKRRLGIGVTGLANAGEALGKPYGSEEFCEWEAEVLETIRNRTYTESALLATEKGAFPLFDRDKYLDGGFAQTLPDCVRDLIATHGIRNSHLTSIAPTGTISLTADNVSSGIEPVFSYGYDRIIQTFDGPRVEHVTDYGYREFGVEGKLAAECSIDDHLNVLLTAQKYVDSAVSKTCNVSPDMPWGDFQEVYIRAWRGGAKGVTTFNPAGKRGGIFNTGEEGAACYIDGETGQKICGD